MLVSAQFSSAPNREGCSLKVASSRPCFWVDAFYAFNVKRMRTLHPIWKVVAEYEIELKHSHLSRPALFLVFDRGSGGGRGSVVWTGWADIEKSAFLLYAFLKIYLWFYMVALVPWMNSEKNKFFFILLLADNVSLLKNISATSQTWKKSSTKAEMHKMHKTA